VVKPEWRLFRKKEKRCHPHGLQRRSSEGSAAAVEAPCLCKEEYTDDDEIQKEGSRRRRKALCPCAQIFQEKEGVSSINVEKARDPGGKVRDLEEKVTKKGIKRVEGRAQGRGKKNTLNFKKHVRRTAKRRGKSMRKGKSTRPVMVDLIMWMRGLPWARTCNGLQKRKEKSDLVCKKDLQVRRRRPGKGGGDSLRQGKMVEWRGRSLIEGSGRPRTRPVVVKGEAATGGGKEGSVGLGHLIWRNGPYGRELHEGRRGLA